MSGHDRIVPRRAGVLLVATLVLAQDLEGGKPCTVRRVAEELRVWKACSGKVEVVKK